MNYILTNYRRLSLLQLGLFFLKPNESDEDKENLDSLLRAHGVNVGLLVNTIKELY